MGISDMADRINQILDNFNRCKERVDLLTSQLDQKDERINSLTLITEDLAKARWAITEVQRLTQIRFKERVESLVTMAIRSVFSKRDYGFELVFEEKRNQMEVKPIIFEMVDGVKHIYDNIEDDFGGGIIDVISIAMRIVLWSLEKPRSRNVIILDEPGKNLGSLITLFGSMLQEISHKLGFQIIIITHDDELKDIADRAYLITHDKVESHAELQE